MAYEALQQMVDESSRIVFFGGAGVSTESGIPDFRSVDGLYHQKYDYPPETILSHTFFMKKPEAFFSFYREKMLPLDAKPNKAHLKLAEWAFIYCGSYSKRIFQSELTEFKIFQAGDCNPMDDHIPGRGYRAK